jgi:hypothetical protein
MVRPNKSAVKQRYNFMLSPEMESQLEEMAKVKGCSRSQVIEDALNLLNEEMDRDPDYSAIRQIYRKRKGKT